MGKREPILVALCVVISFSSTAYAQLEFLLPELFPRPSPVPDGPQPVPDDLQPLRFQPRAPIEGFFPPEPPAPEPPAPEPPAPAPPAGPSPEQVKNCADARATCTGRGSTLDFISWTCWQCFRDCENVDSTRFAECGNNVGDWMNGWASLENDDVKNQALRLIQLLRDQWTRMADFGGDHLSTYGIKELAKGARDADAKNMLDENHMFSRNLRLRNFAGRYYGTRKNAHHEEVEGIRELESDAKRLAGDDCVKMGVNRVDNDDDGGCDEKEDTDDCLKYCDPSTERISDGNLMGLLFCAMQTASYQEDC